MTELILTFIVKFWDFLPGIYRFSIPRTVEAFGTPEKGNGSGYELGLEPTQLVL